MSIPGERDESLDRWLRDLKPAERTAKADCLDAETASAWLSGALSGAPFQQAQAHLADCERCQALVGTLVRADVGGEVVKPEPKPWFSWIAPVGVVATAAAIALTVWVLQPQEPASTAASVGEQAAAQDSQPQVLQKEFPEAVAPAPLMPPPVAGAAVARRSEAPAEAKLEVAQEKRSDAARQDLPMGRTASAPVAVVAPAAEPAAPQAFADSASPSVAAGRGGNRVAESAASIEIMTPDPSVRWRIAGRQIQRSIDAGATWGNMQVGASAPFTAGSAPSRITCWLVGRGGIVLLTTDGVSWTRVPFPEPADLTAITAGDARTAAVTTADGRTFHTADGGKSWTR